MSTRKVEERQVQGAMRVAEVVSYRPGWVEEFARERDRILSALGQTAIELHHIGSTAIPGIFAKPIIDMLLEVRDLDDLDPHSPGLASLGYEALGENGIPDRRFFRRDTGDVRTHHIHAFVEGSPGAIRHLAFRDYMRARPDLAQRYSDLKQALAATCDNDIFRYMDGKDAFVKQAEADALLWWQSRG